MKKLILTKGTEFEQNGKDMAIIDTSQRAGKPIMLNANDLDMSIFNADQDALEKITSDIDKVLESSFYKIVEGSFGEELLIIPEGVKKIRPYGFYQISDLYEIQFPNTLEEIGNSCFYGVSNLQHLNLPENLKVLNQYAFSHCGNISGKIIIPEGVTLIGMNTFYKNTKVEIIEIKGDVTEIGEQAFRYCENLKTLIMRTKTPPTITSSTFSNTPLSVREGTVYVPDDVVNTYKYNAGQYWNQLVIEPLSNLEEE